MDITRKTKYILCAFHCNYLPENFQRLVYLNTSYVKKVLTFHLNHCMLHKSNKIYWTFLFFYSNKYIKLKVFKTEKETSISCIALKSFCKYI